MKTGAIKGWDFSRYYSADGSKEQSTLDSLNAEKRKLEARLIAIPKEVSALNESIKNMQHEYDWLSSLNKRRQKSYEKEKGEHPHTTAHRYKKKIAAAKAKITSINTEKGRIPKQIEAIQKQLDTLIKGESDGLSKGLDKESAKALGEIELEKEKARLEHESKLQQIEADKQQRLAEEEVAQKEEAEQQGNKKGLIIGIAVVVILIIIGYVIYKKRMAKAVNVQPLKT